ncbi:MAG: hypothetical protein DMG98_14505 [Acidobacteria bacterium]|nr:MAG: hypothetical protein DMG98_14505 [Acidobacteriota bacterium]
MMSPFDDTAGMASEQSSREVLKRPLVAALTPTMSDAAIRAAFQNLHDSVLPLDEPGSSSMRLPRGEGVPLGMSRIAPKTRKRGGNAAIVRTG